MCVIASLYLENQSILVKNRDRKYIADVEVIHELRNGVEVLYIHDIGTDWSEGINEFGIGITNATLMVNQDEREGVVVKKRTNTISNDGKKIREALSLHNIDSTVKYLTDYKNKNQTIAVAPYDLSPANEFLDTPKFIIAVYLLSGV